MADPTSWYVEVDGQPAALGAPLPAALLPHGHFTVMQVRAGRVRGLDLHLRRLEDAHRELYDAALPGDLVRARIRQALAAARQDATVRVVAAQDLDAGPQPARLIVAVGPPSEPPSTAQRLMSVLYTRPFAHIKHLGTFGQAQYRRLARRCGFDEALLTGPDGTIAEGATTNVGFRAGNTTVWPAAPALHGVTMALLERSTSHTRAPVRLADLARFDAAVVTNSRGIAPVAAIDGHQFAGSASFAADLHRHYEAVPFDVI
ncbi:aminotransferase class IV [Frankia sp. AgB32]|uniref:aminotransferase class IV n=1 Tax=Frankia sp. AgB32 TaxID=631119 RepID=UPI00200EA087|nr:aminotransferase class IV [Frankia sp. AgB32]MCK9895517.1 aminotransferase class IV [Frankia sp. AgB32]